MIMNEAINFQHNKFLTAFILFLVFLSPLLYTGFLEHPSDLPRYTFIAIISCASLLIFLWYQWRHDDEIYFTSTSILFLCFLIFASISSAWAESRDNNAVFIVQLLNFFVIFFIASQIATTSTIKSILYVSLTAATLSSIIGLLQNFGFNIFSLRGYTLGGTFTFKNHMALYLDLIIPVGICLIFISKNLLIKWLSGIALVICSAYIYYSHTRGSLLAAAVMLGLFVLTCMIVPDIRAYMLQYVRRIIKPLLVILALILVFSLFPGKSEKYLDRPVYEGDTVDISVRERLTAYQNSMYLLRDNPILGVGYGSFWKAFRPYMNHPNIIHYSNENNYLFRLHSDVLQIFIELGVLGGLLFVALIISVYFFAIKLLLQKNKVEEKILILALILAISASLVHALVDFPLLKPSSALQFWLYIGLISGFYARNNHLRFNASMLAKSFLSVLCVFITVFMFAFYYYALLGGYYLNIAKRSLENKDCLKATEYIDKSVHAFGLNFYVHAHRINTHVACNTPAARLFEITKEELNWDDTNVRALLTRGDILIKSGYPSLAMNDYRKVKFLLPHRASGYIGEVLVLIHTNSFKEAQTILDKLKQQYPNDPRIEKVQGILNEAQDKQAALTQ